MTVHQATNVLIDLVIQPKIVINACTHKAPHVPLFGHGHLLQA